MMQYDLALYYAAWQCLSDYNFKLCKRENEGLCVLHFYFLVSSPAPSRNLKGIPVRFSNCHSCLQKKPQLRVAQSGGTAFASILCLPVQTTGKRGKTGVASIFFSPTRYFPAPEVAGRLSFAETLACCAFAPAMHIPVNSIINILCIIF